MREKILAGEYVSGEKLVESSLARNLELSRTTVRMALNTLANEGLIHQRPYAGWEVMTMNDDLWEIYHLRVALEGQAASMAAERIDDEKRAKLKTLADKFCAICQQQGVTLTEVVQCDMELHRLIVELTGSKRLARFYNTVSNQLMIHMHYTHYDFDIKESGHSHVPLIEAICVGDSRKAEELAKGNIGTFTEVCSKLKIHNTENATA